MHAEASLAAYAIVLAAAGFGSGFAGGLFGIGGGILRIPILLYVLPAFGLAPTLAMHVAAGTSLALAIPTGLRSAASQRAAGHLDPAFLRAWTPPLVLGVGIGLLASRHLPGHVLETLFAVALAGLAVEMLVLRPREGDEASGPGRLARTGLALGVGSFSALLGVAGGAFTTPLLTLFRHPLRGAIAVSSVTSAIVSTVGTAGFVINGLAVPGRPAWSLGYVDGVAVAAMLPAIWLGAPLGVRLADRVGDSTLRLAFGALLLVIALDVGRRVATTG